MQRSAISGLPVFSIYNTVATRHSEQAATAIGDSVCIREARNRETAYVACNIKCSSLTRHAFRPLPSVEVTAREVNATFCNIRITGIQHIQHSSDPSFRTSCNGLGVSVCIREARISKPHMLHAILNAARLPGMLSDLFLRSR